MAPQIGVDGSLFPTENPREPVDMVRQVEESISALVSRAGELRELATRAGDELELLRNEKMVVVSGKRARATRVNLIARLKEMISNTGGLGKCRRDQLVEEVRMRLEGSARSAKYAAEAFDEWAASLADPTVLVAAGAIERAYFAARGVMESGEDIRLSSFDWKSRGCTGFTWNVDRVTEAHRWLKELEGKVVILWGGGCLGNTPFRLVYLESAEVRPDEGREVGGLVMSDGEDVSLLANVWQVEWHGFLHGFSIGVDAVKVERRSYTLASWVVYSLPDVVTG